MNSSDRAGGRRISRVALGVGVMALTSGLVGIPLAQADNSIAIDQAVKGSLVYVTVEYAGFVQIPAQFAGGGHPKWSKEVKVDATCTGFVVDPEGFIATAGHCVDPNEPELKDAFRAKFIHKAAADGDISQEDAEKLIAVADHNEWPVEGKDPGSAVARTVEVIQPEGADRVITELKTVQVVDYQKFDDGDNALLKVSGMPALKALPIAMSAPPAGTGLTSIGFPGAINDTVDQSRLQAPSFKSGTASSVQVKPSGAQSTEINADLSPGMSGGPTVDNQTGEVLGINSYGIKGETQAFNFITDAGSLRSFLQKNSVHLAARPAPSASPMSWAALIGVAFGFVVLAGSSVLLLRWRGRRATAVAGPIADSAVVWQPGAPSPMSGAVVPGPWQTGGCAYSASGPQPFIGSL
jgi:serine protease Do